MNDRNPPQGIEAEQAVLCAMLSSRDVCRDVVDVLTSADFYRPAHELIFEAIVRLDGTGEPADPITVAAELDRTQMLAKVGGREYLADLFGLMALPGNATFYAEVVREHAGKRRLLEACLKVSQGVYESPLDVAEQAENARALFDKAMPGQPTGESFSDALPRVVELMEAGGINGLATCWPDLDRFIYGLRPGLLYVVGARPSIGKSIVALQLATGVWEQHNQSTYFASLEMSTDEILQRSLATRSRVKLDRIITGNLTEYEWSQISPSVNSLQGSKVRVVDAGHQTIGSIRSGARTMHRRGDLGLIAIDYLQLVAPRDPKMPREQQVAEVSREAKKLAKELQVPVLLLSQLNRATLDRNNAPPTLANLRESGAIEQDADVVMLMHKPDDNTNEVDIHVAKNRSGPLGVCHFVRQGEYARLVPAASNDRSHP